MAKTDWRLTDVVRPEDMNNIGQEINDLRTDLNNTDIPQASLTKPGIVQLSNETDSDAEDKAATPKAVKAIQSALTKHIEAKVHSAEVHGLRVRADNFQYQTGNGDWKEVVQLSNAINGTRQNVAATEYAVKLAMESVKTENYDGRAEEVFYNVPSQFPSIQAALNAIKLHNAGDRTVKCAPGYVENGSIRFPGFKSGIISISGDSSSPASIKGGISISSAQCFIVLWNLNLTGATSLIDCQTPCVFFASSVNKTVSGGYGAFTFGGQCRAYISNCTISNQMGTAIDVYSNAMVYCSSIRGSGNGRAFSASSGIIFDDGSSNTISATTRVTQTGGGRVFS